MTQGHAAAAVAGDTDAARRPSRVRPGWAMLGGRQDGRRAALGPKPRRTARQSRRRRRTLVLLSWLIGIGVWEAVGHNTSQFVFAPFSDSVIALWHLIEDGTLWEHMFITLRELGVAFSIGAGVGITGGLLAGMSRDFRDMTDHWVTALLALPFAAVFPLFLVQFGLGEASKIALAAFASFLPIWATTAGGMATVDEQLVEMTRTFDGRRRDVVTSIMLPWCVPSLIEGLRIGLTRAFLAVIVGELLASRGGLGFLISVAGQRLRPDILLGVVIVITIITLVLVRIMYLMRQLTVPWWDRDRSS